jgi:hypothetical protein
MLAALRDIALYTGLAGATLPFAQAVSDPGRCPLLNYTEAITLYPAEHRWEADVGKGREEVRTTWKNLHI